MTNQIGKLIVTFGGDTVTLHLVAPDDKGTTAKNRLITLPRVSKRGHIDPNVTFLRTLAAAPTLFDALAAMVKPWNDGKRLRDMDCDDVLALKRNANIALNKAVDG